jgi:glycosyltransferase involved in cell wall biosynthesis
MNFGKCAGQESRVNQVERPNLRTNFDTIASKDVTLSDHFRIFGQLVSRAEYFLLESDFDSAAAFGQMAAEYAWRNHAGFFVSPRLESLMWRVAEKAMKPSIRSAQTVPVNRSIKRVLHIITEALDVGGHTRFAWRWIKSDLERVHSAFLTRQGTHEVPRAFKNALTLSGGKLYQVDTKIGGLVDRARTLQQLANRFDVIVLHIHPYDVLPIIGLSQAVDCPPVIFVNHADHVFWLGVSISDIVTHFRYSGLQLSIARRTIEHKRCAVLPIPVPPADRRLSRSEARRVLNLSDADVVLLSIASAYKYKGRSSINFLDAIVPVVKKCDNTVLLVVGPDAKDLRLNTDPATARRVRFYGKRDDIFLFYQAADIYLDSLPFPSLTSLLEAGMFGLPLVSYCAHPHSSEVLCVDDPGLVQSLVRAENLQTYRKTITELVGSKELRERLGEQTRAEICEIHDRKWPEYREAIYAHALSIPIKEKPQDVADQMVQGELDLRLMRYDRDLGFGRHVHEIIRSHYLLLSLRRRLEFWAQMKRNISNIFPEFLLPDWLYTVIKKLVTNFARRCKA